MARGSCVLQGSKWTAFGAWKGAVEVQNIKVKKITL